MKIGFLGLATDLLLDEMMIGMMDDDRKFLLRRDH